MEEDNVPLPKINKIPFIVVDVLLVLAALMIYFSVEKPLSPINGFWIITSVAAGGFIACLPFFVEFRTTAKLKEYDLSQANTENARRIEAALGGIQEIGESVIQQTDRSAEIAGAFESLLERLEGRIHEVQGGEGGIASLDPEQLKTALAEQLAAVRDDFAQAIAEQAGMSSDKQHDKLNAALSKLQGLPMQVTLLGELAGRYQSLVAMISDTAAQLVESTPAPPGPAKMHDDTLAESSVDGALEPEIEENVAPESAVGELEALQEAAAEEEALEEELPEEDTAEEVEEAVAAESIEEETEALEEFDMELAEEPAAEEEESGTAEEPETLAEAVDEVGEEPEATEDFGEIDARYEDSLEEDDIADAPSDEPPAETEAEPEFLSEADLAEDEVMPEPEGSEAALEELEDDFDIALSGDAEDENAEAAELAEEGVEAAADERREEAQEEVAEGMGFDDWDDFGEIASAEEAASEGVASDAEEEAVSAEPSQAELMADIPEMPKSKPKKAKGVTTLIAQVLIGIGNKPYVRGTGPGLSEDEGVPMEFLEIGKWQWVAPNSDEPVTVRIYKNDEAPAEGDPIEIPAGQRRSVAPKFPS